MDNKIVYINEGAKVLRLHLELVNYFSDGEKEVLKKYGKSISGGITRDILIPDSMLLHNLHYVIQKAFGWQNSHLHDFTYKKEVLDRLTFNKFIYWSDLCGIYFNFPLEDNMDRFWDDDYVEGKSFTSWLKSKYKGPYKFLGKSENYKFCHKLVSDFKKHNPTLNIIPSFIDFSNGHRDIIEKRLEDVSMEEASRIFEVGINYLLERLPVSSVISNKVSDDCFDRVEKIIEMAEGMTDINPLVIPLSDTLVYSYDYGDGWNVNITCVDIYDSNNDNKELNKAIEKVVSKCVPVCIKADGLPLMDDVGGPFGYVDFLKAIHGEDSSGPFENAKDALSWGTYMGWTGKMSTPSRIL